MKRAQEKFRLRYVSYGDRQIREISGFITLISAAVKSTRKVNDDGTQPLNKKRIPH